MHISMYTHIYMLYIYTDIIIAELRLSEYNEKELKARKPTEWVQLSMVSTCHEGFWQ